MMDYTQLIAAAEAKRAEAQAILDTASQDDNRNLTAEEQENFDTLCEEADGLQTRANNQGRLNAASASLDASQGRAVPSAAVQTTTTSGDDVADAAQIVRVGPSRERIEDDPKRGFRSSDQFFMAVRANALSPGTVPAEVSQRLRGLGVMEEGGVKFAAAAGNAAGMSQDVGSAGGFSVPPGFASGIWDGVNDGGPDDLLSMTTPNDMTGVDSWTIPANAETSRATGSRFGGVQGYWISEAATITESNPTLREITLQLSEVAALVPASQKLLRNSAGMGAYIQRAATEELAFLINNAIVSGTGVGQPLGLLNSACTVSVAKEAGQPASTIVTENLDKMWDRILPRSKRTGQWYRNIDTGKQLRQMTRDVGTGGSSAWMPAGGVSAAPFETIFGRPVVEIEYCPTLGTVGDLFFADFSFMASGSQGLEMAESIHVYFSSAQNVFRFMMAIEVRPFLLSAITPFHGTDTLSPFVTLATRA